MILSKIYERLFHQYSEDNSLIIPTEDDWLLASKILYLLSQDRRRSHRGSLKKLHPGASQRMAFDVLIAVSARRWRATVVTENWDDFKAIERFSKTKIVKALRSSGIDILPRVAVQVWSTLSNSSVSHPA